MYLKQKDIFWAMSKEFVKEIMEISVTESHKQGEWLFSLGQTGHVVYIVNNAGEAFGWSSLIGRESFSASAECMTQTKLLKLDKEKLQKILKKDPANSIRSYLPRRQPKYRLLTVPARCCPPRNPSPDNDFSIRFERIAAKSEAKNV
jgi:hypothetical protein